jgi:hypothetical protein
MAPDQFQATQSEIIVSVPAEAAEARKRVAADIVALLKRAGVRAVVFSEEGDRFKAGH